MDYLEKFKKECYTPETIKLLEISKEYINDKSVVMRQYILGELNEYFGQLAKKQKENEKKIGNISMSMLYTSIYFQKPAWQLDAYGEELYFEESFLSRKVKADDFFYYWDEYVEKLYNYIEENVLTKWIHKEQVKMKLYQTMRLLNYQSMAFLKYILKDCKEVPNFYLIEKTEEFYVTYGEYLDWQRLMFAEQKEIDIFRSDKNMPRTFRNYKGKTYEKKTFKGIIFNGSRFHDCDFKSSEFENVEFNDCNFNQCMFTESELKNCEFYGVTFQDCTLKDTTCEGVKLGTQNVKEENVKDLYKVTEFINCNLKDVSFTNSDISNVVLLDTGVKQLMVENCCTIGSDLVMES